MAALAKDAVVLITGASSGIGRAAAQAFSRERARLVLVSRNQDPLGIVAEECRALGGQALALPADMIDEAAVERVRALAAEEYGRIDVWVNCAAILLFGRFEDVPSTMFRHVLENNVLGYVHGSRAALRQFRSQDGRGTLINVGSMLGVVPEPCVSAYVASKFAIRGLTASIRQETSRTPGIHVCTILPAAIDTPIYQKAGNLSGRGTRSILPVYGSERAARAIVGAAKRPRREIKVGGFALLLDLGWRFAPGTAERTIARLGPALQFRPARAPRTEGYLFSSASPHEKQGGWRGYWAKKLRSFGKEPTEN